MSYAKFSNEEDRYQFLKHSSDLHKDTAENDPITVTPIVTGQETVSLRFPCRHNVLKFSHTRLTYPGPGNMSENLCFRVIQTTFNGVSQVCWRQQHRLVPHSWCIGK